MNEFEAITNKLKDFKNRLHNQEEIDGISKILIDLREKYQTHLILVELNPSLLCKIYYPALLLVHLMHFYLGI